MNTNRLITFLVLSCAILTSARDYSGVVVSKAGEKPIEGVLVSIGHSEYYTRTDQNGRFTLKNPTTSISNQPARNPEPQTARWNFRGRTLDLSSAPGVTSASVYAINGKRVFNVRIPQSRIVGLPALAMGTYMLELRGEQGTLHRAQIVLSNQASSSFTFGPASASVNGRRLSKSAQTLAASEQLIFRHDEYLPRDSAMTNSNTNMRIILEADTRSQIFDQSKVYEYRFTIDPDSLKYLNTYGWREEFIPANLKFEGMDNGMVGLRYKGSDYTLPKCFDTTRFTGKTCAKISYKIKFTRYNEDKRFYGMKKLNLHALAADGTKMHDMLSYDMFREMGIPAPRTSYAKVYVNDNLIGLFLAVEEIDGRFTKSRWPAYGDGNLYKEVWPKSTDTKYYKDGLKTNDDPIEKANVQKMVSYYNAINSSNEQNFAQNLSSYMDFDYFLRYLAVDVAIKNWDGMRSWYMNQSTRQAANHNYFFYEEENAGGKIWIIPWDMDQTMGQRDNYFDSMGWGQALPQWNVTPQNCDAQFVGGNNLVPPNCDKLTKLTAAVYWNRYVQLGDLFLKDVFVNDRLIDKINKHTSLISDAVRQDPAVNENDWTREVNSLKGYLQNNITAFKNYIHP